MLYILLDIIAEMETQDELFFKSSVRIFKEDAYQFTTNSYVLRS